MKILGFESSCDETAVAVVEDGRTVLSDAIASQVEVHALYGGVVPEIASRKHVEAIAALTEKALADAGCTRADIDAVASPVVEAQVFDMTRAVSRGDFDRAAELLGQLLTLQQEPFMLLSLMGGELRRLHSARIALDAGRDRFWLMEQWNMRSDYQAKLLLENARRVSRPWCARAVRRCCETDLRIKSVSGADGAGELKLLLMELAQTSRA